MRTFVSLAIALALVATACGGGSPAGTGTVEDTGPKAPDKGVEPASKIVFWHAMGGTNGEAVNKAVDAFNKSQSKITVEAIFQGTYDDALAKLNTALASKAAPALIQVYDIGQRYMIDSGEIVPMQSFIDRDKFDVSDFEPAVANYYKVEGKLFSMPFNSSSSILYYNKEAFREVGLDPEKAPRTFEEVDRKSTRLNSSHSQISYAVFSLKKKKSRPYSSFSISMRRSSLTTSLSRLKTSPLLSRLSIRPASIQVTSTPERAGTIIHTTFSS